MGDNLYQPIQIDHDQNFSSWDDLDALIFKPKWLLQQYFHKDTSNQIQPLGLLQRYFHKDASNQIQPLGLLQ